VGVWEVQKGDRVEPYHRLRKRSIEGAVVRKMGTAMKQEGRKGGRASFDERTPKRGYLECHGDLKKT